MPRDPKTLSINLIESDLGPGFSKRFEDRGRRPEDVIPVPADENRISGARCGSHVSPQTPRSPKTRRLQPIKAASPRKTPTAQPAIGSVKFGPGTKIHDGRGYSRHGSNERGLHKCPSDPGKYPQGGIQIPVTILDLDLEENLQDVKVRRALHGPSGPSLPKKGHIRHHSDPNTSESPVQTELRDQCIVEETSSVSQEDDQECEANLPPTFVTQIDGDMRLSECVSRNSSPEADDGISLVINNPAPISALKENFNIEESQVRTSSDSGLPADASKSGSLTSSGSNSSSGSPRPKEEVKGRSSSTPRERSSSQSSDGPARGASADRSRPKSQAVPPRPKEPPPKPPVNEVVKVNFLTENLDVKTARQSKPIMGVNGGLTRRTSNPRNMPMRPNVPPKKPNLIQQMKDSKTPQQNSALKVRNIQRPNTSTKTKPNTEKTDKSKAPPRPPKPSSNMTKPAETKVSPTKVSPTSDNSPKKVSNVQETPAPVKPSEHTGPVIQDPFESLRREREESKANEVKAKVQNVRTKSAVAKKPVNNPPKKAFEARGSSANKKKVKPKEPADAKVTLNTNKRKVKTAKGRKEKKDSMSLSENDNAAFVSGIGWHIEASRQDALVKERDDSSGSEEDVPKVAPNYDAAPSPMIVRRESVDQDKLRRSLELTSSQMPGQTDQNVEDIATDEEEEKEEEGAAEVMCDEVVFNEAERYQEMLLEAELKARVEEAFEQSKVIPQTIKALEEFSKTMMNEDLTRILEEDSVKKPANDAKCILVKEATEAAEKFSLNLEAMKEVTPISAVEEMSPKSSPLHRSASLRTSIPLSPAQAASPLSSPFQSPTHQSPLHRAASLRGAGHRPSQPLGTLPSQQANVFPTQLSPHRSPLHRITSTANDCSPRVPQSSSDKAQSTDAHPSYAQSSKPQCTHASSSASISSPVKQSPSVSSTASKRQSSTATVSAIPSAQPDQPSSILKQPSTTSSCSKPSTTSVPNPSSEAAIKPSSTVTHSQSASQSSTKQRSTRATKSTGKNPRAPRTREQEEREINHMIDEILKSTPDPTLSLSWRTGKKLRNKLQGMTEEELAKELRLSAGATFEQIPNKAEPTPKKMSESDDHGSFGEEEMETIEKLALALKDLPLKVTDDDEETVVGKPPKAPKNKTTTTCDAKSPRFVRKHDSYKRSEVAASKEMDDWSDSEFGSTFSLPVGQDDSLVHTDRGEVVTSRLGGRRNSNSRAPSAMTNESNEEVETIQWKRGNMLGKGAYGTVWCGLTNTGGLIAVKQIELNTDNMDRAELEYEKIQEEVELLKNLNHKNIVGYLGTSLEEHIVSIFMEFVPGGSIANLLARFGALEEEVFCHYTRQILEGVQYLHANHVIHRDIKGGNIMLMPNSEIKLIDFGCAKRLCLNMSVGSRTKSSSHNRLLKSMRGTPYWMAPEVVKEEGHGTRSDIWSIGCTVFEMATRKPPWAEMPPMTAIFAIGSDSKPVPQLPEKFSSEARQFVNLCLSRDQHKRPSAVQMLNHAFISKRKKSRIS